ncbi:3-hydroxybutyryl-CoA dehydrogenase [Longispora fulva]|uniref:3-hydroxybutyryl-CoA dehydrogenase n=1 Tax=Longispora fulva TaxID=619741 RepID=A0A8J7KIF0_9ACTN|nr:3-hydroxyacyl-CoA dehydrogenase family protein [Longispora fulva]MBG6139470.1 3-hydroxybutyryl-CoA dehydrogenase [Longispora fulva]GIG58147.1 3-hydroxybutyryl-CoA dehydrogenase [Longispora fulva]
MLERFVVIGAGTMGAGIAYVAAGAGYVVSLVEPDPDRGPAAVAGLRDLWAKAVTRGKLSQLEADGAAGRLHLVRSLDEVAPDPSVIVEAVPERLELKRSVLAAAAALKPALLATNTSSIAISSLAEGLPDPSVLCGLHFFNPVFAMPLLEIVLADDTSADARERALIVADRLGKDPVVVRDMPGFATSRLGVMLGLEAIRMLEDGVASAADIDKAMKLGYKHPMGPLELTDVVGLDVRLDIARTLQAAYGDRFAPPQLLIDMVAAGKLGKKTGEGFHTWPAS